MSKSTVAFQCIPIFFDIFRYFFGVSVHIHPLVHSPVAGKHAVWWSLCDDWWYTLSEQNCVSVSLVAFFFCMAFLNGCIRKMYCAAESMTAIITENEKHTQSHTHKSCIAFASASKRVVVVYARASARCCSARSRLSLPTHPIAVFRRLRMRTHII